MALTFQGQVVAGGAFALPKPKPYWQAVGSGSSGSSDGSRGSSGGSSGSCGGIIRGSGIGGGAS